VTVWYLPIEPYEERYTAQLVYWTVDRFQQRGVVYRTLPGDYVAPHGVQTGVALDAHTRAKWGLSQSLRLIRMLEDGSVAADDVIYLQDLYQPGFDALLYVLQQQFPDPQQRPRIFTHNLAQTIDPDDFTHGWLWMRSYEWMVDATVQGVFYASTEHKLLGDVAGFKAQAYVVGLLHDRDGVRQLYGQPIKPIDQRANRIVYTSRFDKEKQPHQFLDLASMLHASLPGYEIAILTSAPTLRSTDSGAVERARGLDWLTIYEGLSKKEYYELLGDSRLQINTARQDWVSNTLLESSALGTPTLAPAFKGFPEALNNYDRCLYVPWSIREAHRKALWLIEIPPPADLIALPSLWHHRTLDRVITVLQSAA
jgi:glycosyltransferase involved in cell wall biosynthesis